MKPAPGTIRSMSIIRPGCAAFMRRSGCGLRRTVKLSTSPSRDGEVAVQLRAQRMAADLDHQLHEVAAEHHAAHGRIADVGGPGRRELHVLRPPAQLDRAIRGGRSVGDGETAHGRLDEPAVDCMALHDVCGAEEIGHERAARRPVDGGRVANLLDVPAVHHHDAVGDRQRLRLVVRDVERGDVEAPLQLADFEPHLLAQLGVEVGQRLVEQQNVRPRDDRPGERDALLLPAGELPGTARFEAAQAHHLQRFLDARRLLGRRQVAHLEAEGDVLRDAHVREQRVGLEHHRGVALVRRHVGHAPVVEPDLAAVGRDEARHHAQGGGLAAARWAEQRDELAVADLEVDVIDRGEGAVFPRESLELEPAHG